MRCFLVFVTALLLLAEGARQLPTDIDRLNAFAGEYNRYAERLKGGVNDWKQWERVERAWARLK